MTYETADGREIVISTRKAANLVGINEVRSTSWWWPFIREASAGAWQRNEEITVENVLTNPTLYTCVTLIAGDVAKMRPRIMQWSDTDQVWSETYSPAFSTVLERPNHYQNSMQFFQWWLICKLSHGNTYVLKRRDRRGVVNGLYILDPHRVKVLVAPDNSVFYELTPSPDRTGLESGLTSNVVVVPAREIIHDRCDPLFHPLIGVSPIFAAGYPALLAKYISNNAQKLHANGSSPGGIITAPGNISLTTAQRLKEQFETEYTGDNFGKVAVLGDNLSYTPMGMASAVDSQLIDVLKWTDEKIAQCFKVPMFKVGGPLPPYSSVEAVQQLYHSDCLHVHTRGLEIVLTDGLELPDKYEVGFNTDDLVRMDSETTMDIVTKGVQGSILTIDEARRKFDLPPIKGGNTVYMQHQDYSIEVLADRDRMGAAALPALSGAPAEPAPAEPEPEPDAEKEASAKVLQFTARLMTKVAVVAQKNTELADVANG